jgi:ribonuclease-3
MTELIERIGYNFKNADLLLLALTHKSFRNEQPTAVAGDNERLEFLGDAVLDLVLSDLLMKRFGADQEGSLSKKRASLVNEEHLAELAREIGLDSYVRLGKGERQTGGLQKPRILASAFEAVLGAIFLDGGFDAASSAITRFFEPRLAPFLAGAADFARDFKTRLQEQAQELFRLTPTYFVEREEGPDHNKIFEVSVRLDNRVLAVGKGRNKKAAEQDAARLALESLATPADMAAGAAENEANQANEIKVVK